MIKEIKKSYQTAAGIFRDFADNEENIKHTAAISRIIAETFQNGNKVLICGNGGSLTDAMHFAEELTGRFRKNRKPLPVIPIADPSHITCTANDFGFEEVFARGVEAFGKTDDILIAISTSGNSQNIINAVEKAKSIGLKSVLLSGKNGGQLKRKCDYEFIVPAESTDRIQEIHILILHIIIEGIERILFPENY
ncbi:MAG: D-sedoheptulose 7-phosphate isomerase [Candidatus Cloacimonetes bacterium]|nr:D-sedoheptulose 7-phosphate isomerase [Candidatus Cloacimonadota bacterium]